MPLALLSAGFQTLPPLPTMKLGLSGADSWVGGFVYILGVWVSPTKSPVRLGVSPTSASTPTGVFYQSFDALFPLTGTIASQLFLLVYLHTNVGPPSPPATTFPTLVLQPLPYCESSPPSCPSPPLLLVWMNVSSLSPWLSDFHTV